MTEIASKRQVSKRKSTRAVLSLVILLASSLLAIGTSLVTWKLLLLPQMYQQSHYNNQVWIVAQSGPGRLGNQMFQYASSLGIYHEERVKTRTVHFCIQPGFVTVQKFSSIFVGPFDVCPEEVLNKAQNLPEKGYGIHTKFDTSCYHHSSSSCAFTLGTYLQSWRYLEQSKKLIQSSLQFQPSIQSQAEAFLKRFSSRDARQTIIGIHVRRDDVLFADYLQAAPASYFEKAMTYYTEKYENVLFLVATEDLLWCAEQPVFQNNNVTFLDTNFKQPWVDLAILATCDHMIVSVGTFGWWAAWLGGGEVVYYNKAIVVDHPTNKGQIRLADCYPPTWIGISG
jgi:galactoside 2-L-fucosyltransferase 1/2